MGRADLHGRDLLNRRPDRRGAAEVTAAADGEAVALRKLLNEDEVRWIEPDLVGGWIVSLFTVARAKRIRRQPPRLLRGSKVSASVSYVGGKRRQRWLVSSGLRRCTRAAPTPGSISTTLILAPERSGGMVPSGDVLARWVSDFLAGRRPKTSATNSCAQAPTSVMRSSYFQGRRRLPVVDLLMHDEAPLPSVPPNLPDAVTHLWVIEHLVRRSWRALRPRRWLVELRQAPEHRRLASALQPQG